MGKNQQVIKVGVVSKPKPRRPTVVGSVQHKPKVGKGSYSRKNQLKSFKQHITESTNEFYNLPHPIAVKQGIERSMKYSRPTADVYRDGRHPSNDVRGNHKVKRQFTIGVGHGHGKIDYLPVPGDRNKVIDRRGDEDHDLEIISPTGPHSYNRSIAASSSHGEDYRNAYAHGAGASIADAADALEHDHNLVLHAIKSHANDYNMSYPHLRAGFLQQHHLNQLRKDNKTMSKYHSLKDGRCDSDIDNHRWSIRDHHSVSHFHNGRQVKKQYDNGETINYE